MPYPAMPYPAMEWQVTYAIAEPGKYRLEVKVEGQGHVQVADPIPAPTISHPFIARRRRRAGVRRARPLTILATI